MVELGESEDEEEPLDVHDLPQLYTRPPPSALFHALSLIDPAAGISPPSELHSLGLGPYRRRRRRRIISPVGLPSYLTQIVASPLDWFPVPSREEIYALASHHLASLSGTTARPTLTRGFAVTESLVVTLREPALTEDNLGLKTWGASIVLARKLPELREHLPSASPPATTTTTTTATTSSTTIEPDVPSLRILELGSGTGLLGLAAACLLGPHAAVTLTDLPSILENLSHNVSLNAALLAAHAATATVRELDWSSTCAQGPPPSPPSSQASGTPPVEFPLVLAADPLYSPHHPGWLVDTVAAWLARTAAARFAICLPLRQGYEREREEVGRLLARKGLVVIVEGEAEAEEDWADESGERVRVRCRWGVWGWME